MNSTRDKIRKMVMDGKSKRCSHVIIACDTFDFSDYPVFVSPGENVRMVVQKTNEQKMQRVMEVYNLSLDIEKQLDEDRPFNF